MGFEGIEHNAAREEFESVERRNFFQKIENGLLALQAERVPDALAFFMQARKLAEAMEEGTTRTECLEAIADIEREFGTKEDFERVTV